ncbi:MAG: metalloregulator ArsR/SmtB family transcription factor [Carboxydocellales bacterium]
MAEWVDVLKALANKNRLDIFQYLRHEGNADSTPEQGANPPQPLLAKGQGLGPGQGQAQGQAQGQGVTELARVFELSPSTVSEHLKELRRAGLIKAKKNGPWIRCRVNQDMLQQLSSYFAPEQGPSKNEEDQG